jgi:hypothetical protein
MKKVVMFSIMLLFIVGCASTTKVVDRLGKSVPDKLYVSKSVGDLEMTAVFYFVAYKKEKDLDGVFISTPLYPEWRVKHKFVKDSEVEMIVEVYNPKELPYFIYSRLAVDKKMDMFKSEVRGDILFKSNKPQRSYKFKLPTAVIADNIRYIVDVMSEEGGVILSAGPFNYSVEGQSVFN